MQRLVPETRPGWRLTLWRAWCVLGCIVAWFVFIEGSRQVHFKEAVLTLGAWYVVGRLIAWIFRPTFPD